MTHKRSTRTLPCTPWSNWGNNKCHYAQIPYPWNNDFCKDNNCKVQTGLRLKVHNSRCLYYKLITDSEIRMKGLVPICLLSIALISCGQTDNRTDCAHLMMIRKNSNSDQKIKASELRMELSKRIKLTPKQVDLFCIHYLGKTSVVRRLPPKKTPKSLQT